MSHLLTGFFRQETHKKTAGVKQDYNRLGNQKYSVFSKMDITVGYEPASGSSILSGPASFRFRGIGTAWGGHFTCNEEHSLVRIRISPP